VEQKVHAVTLKPNHAAQMVALVPIANAEPTAAQKDKLKLRLLDAALTDVPVLTVNAELNALRTKLPKSESLLLNLKLCHGLMALRKLSFQIMLANT